MESEFEAIRDIASILSTYNKNEISRILAFLTHKNDHEGISKYIKLLSYGERKIACIKAVRGAIDIGLREAKELVESAPVRILVTSDVNKFLEELGAAGAIAYID